MTSTRSSVVVACALAVFAALAAGGCDALNDRRSLPLAGNAPASAGTPPESTPPPTAITPVTPVTPTDAVMPADAGAPADKGPPPDAGTPPPEPGTYAAMCTHYCATLETTLLYSCLASGQGDPTTCQARFVGTTAQCYDIRCVPMRVTENTCITQCASLASQVATYCSQPAASASLCTAPDAPTDPACRASCMLDAG